MPAGSLYRHVARLVAGGVLSVVSERRVRGAVERTYVLRTAAARIGPGEVAKMTAEEHRAAFLAFVAGLIGDADRYLARDSIDPARDGASYSLAAMWLDDTEFTEFLRELVALVQPLLAHAPKPGRKRRIFATVLLPGAESDNGR